MTTATKPLPPHGTTARAYGSSGYRPPCKCTPCRDARNRHHKHMRVNRELGRSPFTDPKPAQARLQELHQTMSWKSLMAATGLELSALVNLYSGRRTKIRHETHAKVMAVVPPAKGDGGQYIDVTGSTRRVQALSCLGHSYTAIAQSAGTARNRILSIANGRQPTVRRDLAERLAAAYQQLAFKPPVANKHTTRTRNVARSKNWRGPLDWDDIDNPNAKPETGRRRQDGPGRREKVDDNQVARLTAEGLSAEQIARELHCHKRTVVRARGRAQDMAAAA